MQHCKTLMSHHYRSLKGRDDTVSEVIEMEIAGAVVTPGNFTEVLFTIIGKEVGEYVGEIAISDERSQLPGTARAVLYANRGQLLPGQSCG